MRTVKRTDFHYELPAELIAQRPADAREDSRLLVLDGASGALEDRMFRDLPELLEPGDLLVLNDTRVLPARFEGRKPSGGRVELLLERVLDARRARVQIRASRNPRPGATLELAGGASARVIERDARLFEIEIELDCDVIPYLEAHGRTPLPPYITRADDARDATRYQTVYARAPGAVAAPTAGLHFDTATFAALVERGVEHAFLTLHVGAGTFAPLPEDELDGYELHAEWLAVTWELSDAVERARARGRRVVAVGTTAVRGLEAAARGGVLEPYEGDTRLFIRPGFEFNVVDAIVTNFHLPESSLLMLVAAFAGREHTLSAYRHAVAERYRFFSYGDAMLVMPAAPRPRGGRDAL